MRYHYFIIFFFIFTISCVPKAFLLDQPQLLSVYFDRKIKNLEKNDMPSIDDQRDLIRTKVEYGFGVIMEQADRLIDMDYYSAIDKYKEANIVFKEARDLGILVLNRKYPSFDDWLRNEAKIKFIKNDVIDLYWLAAAYGGTIGSSRGNPFELIHLPSVGRLLRKCIELDPEWNNGAIYSAMMSFTATRSDLSSVALRDSVDFYFDKAIFY